MITRRQFASGLAGAGLMGLLAAPGRAGEPAPETTRLRFIVIPDSICKNYTKQEGYAGQAIREVPYGRWREYDVTDTVRFYALRLHEAGFIEDTPQEILARGVYLRFFNELKQELKG